MTNLVYDALLQLAPQRRSGREWQTFNCPACVHQGTTPDRRKRAGISLRPDNVVIYKCFNCKFSTGYEPGNHMPNKMAKLLTWMGMDAGALSRLTMAVWQIAQRSGSTTIPLPRDARPMQEWLDDHCQDMRFLRLALTVAEIDPANLKRFWWTPEPGNYHLDNCVIDTEVPYENRMGWEAFNLIDGGDPIGPQGPVSTPEIDLTDPKWAADMAELERLDKLNLQDAQDEQ